MAEFFLELLVAFFCEMLMFYPGAFIRWCFLGRKKGLSHFISDTDNPYSYLLSFLLICAVILGIAVKQFA
ncbi:hypothetical protein SAMN05444144_11731 [Flavobacterium akiainvivens]|nr:hypothetical protein SAMN05444144_11731 [Flavobacterium akiainvivens]